MEKPKIAVIGGGAAGMMAAIFAAEGGADVTVFDKNEKAGRKLGITGKGRCNLTNHCTVDEFIAQVRRNPRFLYTAASAFPPEAVMDFFENKLGVPLKTERGNRVFPVSDRAGDVVYALVKEMRRLGCRYQAGTVQRIETDGDAGQVTGITVAHKFLPFDRVIVCTGGGSYPLTGSTGDGLRFATEAGLQTIPFRPSLIPLTVAEKDCADMMGLSLKNTGLRLIDNQSGKILYEDLGEMLFTHFGVSGPMVLSASAHLPAVEPGRFSLALDLKPALDEKTLDERLLRDFAKFQNRDFQNALHELLPQKMIPVIVRRAKIAPAAKVNSITKEQRRGLVALLKHYTLTVTGVRPLAEAIISAGGVDVREISPGSMECKKIKGLYFAGETLDLDAYTGGFNLQIAFCTGRLAGISAAHFSTQS